MSLLLSEKVKDNNTVSELIMLPNICNVIWSISEAHIHKSYYLDG